MTPEELEVYKAKCARVGSQLYSYGKHLQRYEDAPQSVKDYYSNMAHMSRVWWNIANEVPIFDRTKNKG